MMDHITCFGAAKSLIEDHITCRCMPKEDGPQKQELPRANCRHFLFGGQ